MERIRTWMCLALAGCLLGGCGSTPQSESEAVLSESTASESVILDYSDYDPKAEHEEADSAPEETTTTETAATTAQTTTTNATTTTPAATTEATTTKDPREAVNSGDYSLVTPAFKKEMDAYEAFYDEYIAFMKKYTSGTGDMLGMLNDYTKMMQRLSEMTAWLDNIDEQTLTPADDAYYLLVTLRVSNKLMKAAL